MRKLVKLKKNNALLYSSQITEYIAPEYIYLPVYPKFNLLVKNNETVFKGQIVMENNLNKVLSPISGVFIGSEKKIIDGNVHTCLVIQNDYKEKKKNALRKSTVNLDRDKIISKLYDFYFKGIASTLESRKINNLIINGIDDEPYILNRSYIMQNFYKEILEMTDILRENFNIKNAMIVIKNSDTKNIETYLSNICMYPSIVINLVEDKYLLGNDFFLREEFSLKESDTLVIDAKTILNIYEAVIYNKHTLESFITISGPMVEKGQIVKVKIGTSFDELIQNVFKLKEGKKEFVLNGLMTGKSIDIKNVVISKDTLGLIIVKKGEEKEGKCINCGLCYKICPVKVNAKKVMDTKMISKSCIDCGLCSYICPCNINLRKFLRGEK